MLSTQFITFMLLSNFEYIFLRLRKFVLREYFLAHFSKWIPYYQVSQNEISPVPIVDIYWKYCLQKDVKLICKRILEIGCGSTNSTGYEIIGRDATNYYIGYEPFASLNEEEDNRIYQTQIQNRFGKIDRNRILRISDLKNLNKNSVDVVFSKSVLEHVDNLDILLIKLKDILKKEGYMIHVVDYRDHFFKYPFHFLQFSKRIWNSLLNPGDLTRSRITDHIRSFQKNGFSVEILERKIERSSFNIVKEYIHSDFKIYNDEDVSTTYAVLFIRHSQ